MIFEPFLYSYGYIYMEPYWNHKKMRKCDRIHLVKGGNAWYTDALGQKHPLLAGHLYLIPARAHFAPECLPEDPIDHYWFDFLFSPPLTTDEIIDIDLSSADKNIKPLKHTAELLACLATLPFDTAADTVKAAVCLVVQQTRMIFSEKFALESKNQKALARIHRLKPDGTLDIPSIKELSEISGLAVDHFIRIFKKEVGTTPYQYILNHRLNVANAHIEGGGTVTEAATLVGYESDISLYHAIRKHRNKP